MILVKQTASASTDCAQQTTEGHTRQELTNDVNLQRPATNKRLNAEENVKREIDEDDGRQMMALRSATRENSNLHAANDRADRLAATTFAEQEREREREGDRERVWSVAMHEEEGNLLCSFLLTLLENSIYTYTHLPIFFSFLNSKSHTKQISPIKSDFPFHFN
ncbi:unnamed protein product [Citrullus colocynthis]|uniref:Uncharacterized protein n=1 Tax=Citrullus colocynthis TaxID=252529 RepID=A0ABP0Y5B5_9ROSI